MTVLYLLLLTHKQKLYLTRDRQVYFALVIIITSLIVKLKIWAGPPVGVYTFCLLKR